MFLSNFTKSPPRKSPVYKHHYHNKYPEQKQRRNMTPSPHHTRSVTMGIERERLKAKAAAELKRKKELEEIEEEYIDEANQRNLLVDAHWETLGLNRFETIEETTHHMANVILTIGSQEAIMKLGSTLKKNRKALLKLTRIEQVGDIPLETFLPNTGFNHGESYNQVRASYHDHGHYTVHGEEKNQAKLMRIQQRFLHQVELGIQTISWLKHERDNIIKAWYDLNPSFHSTAFSGGKGTRKRRRTRTKTMKIRSGFY
jgi:hypothetical protein